jgi:hypothetical protein
MQQKAHSWEKETLVYTPHQSLQVDSLNHELCYSYMRELIPIKDSSITFFPNLPLKGKESTNILLSFRFTSPAL